jgi:hypothetical protein
LPPIRTAKLISVGRDKHVTFYHNAKISVKRSPSRETAD